MAKLTETIKGFMPLVNDDAETLILGTLPGNITIENYLSTGNIDYYFNFARNHFWLSFGKILCLDLQLITDRTNKGYQYRKQVLSKYKIALWDIYDKAEREIGNSSDKKIKNPSPNDLRTFLICHPNIKYVYTNGLGTYKKFIKINKNIQSNFPHIIFKGLTSTSNANNGHFDINEWENALNLIK